MEQPTTEKKTGAQPLPKHYRFASLGVRMAAAIVDGLVYLPVLSFGVYNIFVYKSFTFDLLVNLFPLFYKPLMEWKFGATIGKMVVRLRVISRNSLQISLDQAMARFTPFFIYLAIIMMSNFYLFNNPAFATALDLDAIAELQQKSHFSGASSFASFILFFSVFYMVTNRFRQGLHDKLARTFCVHYS